MKYQSVWEERIEILRIILVQKIAPYDSLSIKSIILYIVSNLCWSDFIESILEFISAKSSSGSFIWSLANNSSVETLSATRSFSNVSAVTKHAPTSILLWFFCAISINSASCSCVNPLCFLTRFIFSPNVFLYLWAPFCKL